jgi:hypothetical protein
MLPILGHLLASTMFGRRCVSAVLLAAYVVTAAGVPLPLGGKRQAGDESYPCANCRCGCSSAEQCWRSCCCHTLAERFAWAREHQVRPPEYAIAAAQAAGLDLAWLGVKSLPPCCSKRATVACEHAEHSCCKGGHHELLTVKAPSPCPLPKGEGSHQGDHIVAWRALACHGQSLNWLAATPTLVVARPVFSHDLPLAAWLGPAASEAAELLPVIPELPPPEQA